MERQKKEKTREEFKFQARATVKSVGTKSGTRHMRRGYHKLFSKNKDTNKSCELGIIIRCHKLWHTRYSF
jgi:ribosome assembly protein YihI (activator of Der GTPase)